jgi:hypothetical protein
MSFGFGRNCTNQAVCPSKLPVFGIFFSCCGVIFAVSGPPGTPRGPSLLRAISSSVGRSVSRVSRGILRSHAADRTRKCHCGNLTVRGWSASTTLNSELWTSRWPL